MSKPNPARKVGPLEGGPHSPSLGPARAFRTTSLLGDTASAPPGKPDARREFSPTQPLPSPGGVLPAASSSPARAFSPLEAPLLPGRNLAGGSKPVDVLEVTEFIRREARYYAEQGNWEAAYPLFAAAETNTRIHKLIIGRHKAAGGKRMSPGSEGMDYPAEPDGKPIPVESGKSFGELAEHLLARADQQPFPRHPGMTLMNHLSGGIAAKVPFSLGQPVVLACSGEKGTITRICLSQDMPPQYYVRYKSADGRQVEAWWGEDAIGYQDL